MANPEYTPHEALLWVVPGAIFPLCTLCNMVVGLLTGVVLAPQPFCYHPADIKSLPGVVWCHRVPPSACQEPEPAAEEQPEPEPEPAGQQ